MELALRLSAVLTKAAIKAKSEALMKRSPSEGKRAEAAYSAGSKNTNRFNGESGAQ